MTTMIATAEVGTRRGIWATAAVDEIGLYGVLIGRHDDVSSLATFVPESRFAEVRDTLPADLQEVFDGAVRRLAGFKARRRALVQ
jgi:hypothetical protein